MSHSQRRFAVIGVAMLVCLAWPASIRGQELPEGLRHVPRDAMAFVHVRIGDFLLTKLGKQLRQQAGRSEIVRELEEKLGIRDTDIESVTVLVLPPVARDVGGNREQIEAMNQLFLDLGIRQSQFQRRLRPEIGFAVVCTTTQPYERKKLLRLLDADTSEDLSLVCLSERSFLVGPPEGLALYADHIAHPSTKNDRLKIAFDLAAQKHHLSAGGYLPAHVKALLMAEPANAPGFNRPENGGGLLDRRMAAMLAPLANLRVAAVSVDVDDAIKVDVQLHGTNEESTALALESAKTCLAYLQSIPAEDFTGGETIGKILTAAKITRQGTQAQISLQVDPQQIQGAMTTLAQGSARQQSANNLKQIGIALHAYSDVYKRLPPQAINDQNGKPLLSWRVAILPFIEEQALYQQFDLNLPWDHPHNKKLIDKMPKILAPVTGSMGLGLTHYQIFAGQGLPMDVQGMKRNPGQFPGASTVLWQIQDGTSNTIAAVEAAEPVIWTKPDDLVYDRQKPLPKLGGMFKDGYHVLMFDGSVSFKRNNLSEETLRRAIEPNDGQPLPSDWYRDQGRGIGRGPTKISDDRPPFIGVPKTEPKDFSEPKKTPAFDDKKVFEEKKPEVPAKIIFEKNDKLTANDGLDVDPVRRSLRKSYDVNLRAGESYVISMRSSDFDTYLRLEFAGKELARDDDGGGGLNSRIVFTPERTGDYRIIATSFNGLGNFTLTVGQR